MTLAGIATSWYFAKCREKSLAGTVIPSGMACLRQHVGNAPGAKPGQALVGRQMCRLAVHAAQVARTDDVFLTRSAE